MNEAATKPFGLTVERREKAVLTGVTDVERFDETEVVMMTHGGRLTVTGTGLHVAGLMLEEGRLLLEGSIDSASYDAGGPRHGSRRGGFFRRALG